jgi:hypothetical protein
MLGAEHGEGPAGTSCEGTGMRLLMMLFGVGGAIGTAVAITPANSSLPLPSVQGLSSTVIAARSGPRQYDYRGRYHQNYNPDAYRTPPRTPEYNVPDAYPTGSSRWWEEMDRQNRGGR